MLIGFDVWVQEWENIVFITAVHLALKIDVDTEDVEPSLSTQ